MMSEQMSQVLDLAQQRGINPKDLLFDFATISTTCGMSMEELAKLLLRVIQWEPGEKEVSDG